jgi:hypothetical protein
MPARGRLPIVDVRDQGTAELLRALIEEVRTLREQTTALLDAILRKLDALERTPYS